MKKIISKFILLAIVAIEAIANLRSDEGPDPGQKVNPKLTKLKSCDYPFYIPILMNQYMKSFSSMINTYLVFLHFLYIFD